MTTYIGTYAISDTENELSGMLHGTSISQIVSEFGVYNRAARRILDEIDPQETKVFGAFGKVYNGIFDYSIFSDMKGNKLIDLYPFAQRTLRDNYNQDYNKDFDLFKNYRLQPDFSMKFNSGVRTVRINATNLIAGTQINAADGPATNGTWVAGGNAGSLVQNQNFFTDGVAGSLQLQLTAGANPSTGYVENSTMSSVDLTVPLNNNADNFFWVYIPDVTAVTSIEYRLGSDASNYYKLAITNDFLGNAWVNGWNMLKASFTGMTKVGSPAITLMNYIRVTFTFSGTVQNQVLINQFYSRIGVQFMAEYYSRFLFRDGTTNAFKEKVTLATDFVNLDTESYNIFLFAVGAEVVQQMQGLDALFYDANQFEQRYIAARDGYKQKYKSEIIKPRTIYYRKPMSSYRRYYGQNYRNW